MGGRHETARVHLRDVGYWHIADIERLAVNVRYWGVKRTSPFKGVMSARPIFDLISVSASMPISGNSRHGWRLGGGGFERWGHLI